MKKCLKNQEPQKKFQLHRETLQNITGNVTVGAQPKTDLEAAPGTTDWTCTEYPSAGC